MNARGQYGKLDGQSRTYVGASLLHRLELKQRYDNAKTAAVQALLNDLSRDGIASSVGTNRWEIALKEGAWVDLTWYPDYSALEVTITDRELRRVDQVGPVRRRYEEILRKITPRLQNFGVTTVGASMAYHGASRERVGITLFHGTGDRDSLVKQLDTEWNAIVDSSYRAMGLDPKIRAGTLDDLFHGALDEDRVRRDLRGGPGLTGPLPLEAIFGGRKQDVAATDKFKDQVISDAEKARQSPLWSVWSISISPAYEEWKSFKREQGRSWYDTLSTNWEDYERWFDRLMQMRSVAKENGIKLLTPDPVKPSKTLWEKAGERFEEIFKIAKWGVIGALGIGALVALSSVASNLRSGKDPGEKYMDLIRQRSRATRTQLALPPGESEDV